MMNCKRCGRAQKNRPAINRTAGLMSFMFFRDEQRHEQPQGEEQKENDKLKGRDECAFHTSLPCFAI